MNERSTRMMRQTPTGNNLQLGSFVVTYLGEESPVGSQLTAPDGTIVLQLDTGVLVLWAYTRDTGWQTIP